MSVFTKLKQFKDLRDQAKKIEDVLGQERIEVTGAKGLVKLTMNGKQEVISLVIDPSLSLGPEDSDGSMTKEITSCFPFIVNLTRPLAPVTSILSCPSTSSIFLAWSLKSLNCFSLVKTDIINY